MQTYVVSVRHTATFGHTLNGDLSMYDKLFINNATLTIDLKFCLRSSLTLAPWCVCMYVKLSDSDNNLTPVHAGAAVQLVDNFHYIVITIGDPR